MSKILTFGGYALTVGSNAVAASALNPYTPLPPLTGRAIRVKLNPGEVPEPSPEGASATRVSESENIWDITYNSDDWDYLLTSNQEIVSVLDANTTGVTSMNYMFAGCSDLKTVPLFNTSNVTGMGGMFEECVKLTAVPAYNTSAVKNMAGTFHECWAVSSLPNFNVANVEENGYMCCGMRSLSALPDLSFTNKLTYAYAAFAYTQQAQGGIYNMYTKLAALSPVPVHSGTFFHCGDNTQTGSAELARIPNAWKSDPWA